MPDEDTITHWIDRLKAGDRSKAVERLWSKYFFRLVELARRHLHSRVRSMADEEDVALSAFDSFIAAAQKGRFPKLSDRDDLWQILFVVTKRKAADYNQGATRLRRGGNLSIRSIADHDCAIETSEPSPLEAAVVAEELQRRMSILPDSLMRQIAVFKLEGYTNEEIGAKLDRSIPTIERKLARIRDYWKVEETEQS